MKQTFTRYVIQREDGKFYFSGNIASYHGYTGYLDEAYLFKKQYQAKKSAIRESNIYKDVHRVEVKEVKVTIEIE